MRAAEPISIGSLLSRSWAVLRSDFGALLFLVSIFQAPLILVDPFSYMLGPDRWESLSVTLRGLSLLLIALPLSKAAVGYRVFRQLRGAPAGIGECLVRAVSLGLPLIGASIVGGLAIAAGFLFCLIPGFIFMFRVLVMIPALTTEELSVGAAWRRSGDMIVGYRYELFFSFATVLLLNLAAEKALTGLLGSLGPELHFVVRRLPGFIMHMIFSTLSAVLASVAYHDIRLAKNDLEQEDLAEVFA